MNVSPKQLAEFNSTRGECFMFIPDFIIGAVALAVILALLPARIRFERAEWKEESKQPEKPTERRLSDQRFDELLTLLPQRPAEAPHPWDSIPYDLTVVIHPGPVEENDRSKWN